MKMILRQRALLLGVLLAAVLCAGCGKTAAPKTPEQRKAESLHLFARNMSYVKPLEVRTAEVPAEETEEEKGEINEEDLEVLEERPPLMDMMAMLAQEPLERPYYMLWEEEVGFWGNEQFGELEDGTPRVYTKQDTLSGSAYEALIFDYLVNDLKLNVAAACGILANIEAECNFRPGLLESKYIKSLGYDSASYTASVDAGVYTNFAHDHAGYGLTQWTYWKHKEGLLKFARQKGVSISDYKMQLEYMAYEMAHEYKSVWKAISSVDNTAQGAYDAGWYFCYYYERPAKYETSSVKRGLNAANKYWKKYGNFVPGRDNISVEIPHESKGQVVAAGLLLDAKELSLKVGETHRLKATFTTGVTASGVTWSSDDEKVAKVSSQGNVKGVKNGTCTITATDEAGHKATCIVTVGEKLTAPKISVSTAKKKSGLQLIITWDTQESAESYTIEISGPDTEESKELTKTEYKVIVKESGVYRVKITARNENDEASVTAKVTVSVKGGNAEESDEPQETEPQETEKPSKPSKPAESSKAEEESSRETSAPSKETAEETTEDHKKQQGEDALEAIENAEKGS